MRPSNGSTISRERGRPARIFVLPCGQDGRAPLHWHISKLIAARRSNGERELHELSGKSLLLPKDPAFHPDGEGLK